MWEMQETPVGERGRKTGKGSRPKQVTYASWHGGRAARQPTGETRKEREQCFSRYLGQGPGCLVLPSIYCDFFCKRQYKCHGNVKLLSKFLNTASPLEYFSGSG